MVFFRAIIFFSCLFIDIYTWRKLLWVCVQCAFVYVTNVHNVLLCLHRSLISNYIFFSVTLSVLVHSLVQQMECAHRLPILLILRHTKNVRFFWKCHFYHDTHSMFYEEQKNVLYLARTFDIVFVVAGANAALLSMPSWQWIFRHFFLIKIQKNTTRALFLFAQLYHQNTDAVWSSALFKRATIQCFQMKWIKMGVSIYVRRRTNYKTDNIEKTHSRFCCFLINMIILTKSQHTKNLNKFNWTLKVKKNSV